MRQTIQELVERYQNSLYAVAFNVCKNQQDAEDAVPAAHFQSACNLCRRQFRFVQHPLEALRKSKMLVHAPPPSAAIRALTGWSAFLPSLTHNFILSLANNLSSILATDFHFR